MRRVDIILLLAFTTLTSNAFVNVMCDVIYKNNDGKWSDFYRIQVTFCLGHEINKMLESQSVFAVIRSSDNQRIVLKMKGSYIQIQELDMFNTFLLLCSNDLINQGIDFELCDADVKQDWKVYVRDEIGLLIDQKLASTQEGRAHDEGTLRNRQNGFNIDREKPKDALKYTGDLGEIVYKDQWLFYIIKVNDKYLAMERKDFSIIKSEVGEIMVGNFSVIGSRRVFYNKSRDIDGYEFIVLKAFRTYEDCVKFIKSKWPY